MTNVSLADTFMPVPRAPLSVRGRRSQYGGTGPEGRVRSVGSGLGGARLARAGAEAGEGRA
jgi:hypothetical protein